MQTARLVLRPFGAGDAEAFARMNADPECMRFFPAPLTRIESDALLARIRAHYRQHGFGFWALVSGGSESNAARSASGGSGPEGEFIGTLGLWVPTFDAHFTPCVEIGWRLAPRHWGRGFATEAGRRVLEFAFHDLERAEIVSFTSRDNLRSVGVMERLGMRRDPRDDFEHPSLPNGHPLRPHVLYRLKSPVA